MKFLIAAIALTLPVNAFAQAAKPCVQPAEAEALITFALPSLIRGVSKVCAKSLPATSSLIQSGPVIASRYQVEADRAWPDARTAVDKMAGMKMSEALGEAGARGLLETVFEDELGNGIKPGDCPAIDSIVTGLAPLPARNIAMVVVAILQASDKPGKKNPIAICRAGAAAK